MTTVLVQMREERLRAARANVIDAENEMWIHHPEMMEAKRAEMKQRLERLEESIARDEAGLPPETEAERKRKLYTAYDAAMKPAPKPQPKQQPKQTQRQAPAKAPAQKVTRHPGGDVTLTEGPRHYRAYNPATGRLYGEDEQ